MKIGTFDIDRTMFPSYEIGKDYPLRQYSFMQDTLNNALNKQSQIQNPQNGINISSQNAQQSTQW